MVLAQSVLTLIVYKLVLPVFFFKLIILRSNLNYITISWLSIGGINCIGSSLGLCMIALLPLLLLMLLSQIRLAASSLCSSGKLRRVRFSLMSPHVSPHARRSGHGHALLSTLSSHFEGVDSLLLVGEGDFGFAHALVAESNRSMSVTASTWDSQEVLENSFADAAANTASIHDITFGGSVVKYGIDATKVHLDLEDLEEGTPKKYDCVAWNFPHISGKQNIKRNRELLLNFFNSAQQVLKENGCIKVSLCGGQSGTNCKSTTGSLLFFYHSTTYFLSR